ncbi:MAG: rhomboid family intramembrane serine protease, partial [Deltaproteobacteria bacterium]
MLTSPPRDANDRRPWRAAAITGGAAALALVALHLLTRAQAGGELDLDALVRMGAKVDARVADGEWWRLVVSVYLHAGWVHVALNAAWLALFLTAVATLLGPARALATALATAYLGQLASFALAVGPSVGASGAVYGLAA